MESRAEKQVIFYFRIAPKTVSHFLIANCTQERQDAPINCDNSENSDKQCLLDPAKYFANMVFTLNFRVKLFGILKLIIQNTCFHLKLVDLCIISSDWGP